MNLVLFKSDEVNMPLAVSDRRAQHVLHVLRRTEGDSFDAGLINGPRGKATVTKIAPSSVTFLFDPVVPVVPPSPITLLVGLPRPQTARDILRDATTLGVAAIHFVRTEKSEPNYAQSTLWSSGEWRRHVIAGAEQAFDTRIPEVTHGRLLADVLAAETGPHHCVALDNYEAAEPLSQLQLTTSMTAVLAIGCERGWSAAERTRLREANFSFAHLGTRILRTETAVVAALTLVRSKLGLL